MAQNTTNNATINAASVNVENKEDNTMMNMTVKELKARAAELKIKVPSRIKKADLMDLIAGKEKEMAEKKQISSLERAAAKIIVDRTEVRYKPLFFISTKWGVDNEGTYVPITETTATRRIRYFCTLKYLRGALYGSKKFITSVDIPALIHALVVQGYINEVYLYGEDQAPVYTMSLAQYAKLKDIAQ